MVDRKEQMREMLSQGMTYEEIGREFGISRQRVYQLIGNADTRKFQYFSSERCVYDGLRKYLNENRISTYELARRCFNSSHPKRHELLSGALKGSNTTKHTIDKILAVTGLTYEEAFADHLIANDVQVIKQATWIINPDGYYPYCSNCNYEPDRPQTHSDNRTPYCPNCGAKMKKEWE
jgi:hypothetical protein